MLDISSSGTLPLMGGCRRAGHFKTVKAAFLRLTMVTTQARRSPAQFSRTLIKSLFFAMRPHRYFACYENVLGTSLEFQTIGTNQNAGSRAEAALLAEIDRLELIFNAYNPASELSRWQKEDKRYLPVSRELAELLAVSENWRLKTLGAFNPAVEALTRLWTAAAAQNQKVDECTLKDTVAKLSKPLWEVDWSGPRACRLSSLPVTLNSIAKGYIVDCACRQAALVEGIEEILISIGGDLCHLGHKPLEVAIADPFADAENATPATSIHLFNQGLATSGNYRRGFLINGQHFSHVLDPRSGQPVQETASVSVIAANTQTADVLATAFSVLSPLHSLSIADSLTGVGVFIVTPTGQRFSNNLWKQQEN